MWYHDLRFGDRCLPRGLPVLLDPFGSKENLEKLFEESLTQKSVLASLDALSELISIILFCFKLYNLGFRFVQGYGSFVPELPPRDCRGAHVAPPRLLSTNHTNNQPTTHFQNHPFSFLDSF